MEISPAAGKILGMMMAYAVSSLGLLLAYYNYRKRVVKADEIFSPMARKVMWLAGAAALIGIVLIAAALSGNGETGWVAIRSNLAGILFPAAVFAFSFWMTWLLY
ncbi:MAG: hypothetical protein ABIJ42_11915, partial [Acidobacteriota bacterium]